jgi:hypothetical protein
MPFKLIKVNMVSIESGVEEMCFKEIKIEQLLRVLTFIIY